MECYFDNSATTRCYESVKDIVVKTMTEDFGNPSAMHQKGVEAEQYIKKATASLAALLKVNEKEILYTSGGTESDNLALIGGAYANRRAGQHILVSAIEHPAVMEPAMFLREQGFDVEFIPVDSRGVVQPEVFAGMAREDTILASVMYVNNETGSVQPAADLGRILHKKAPGALFHVDAVQGFGKYRIHPGKQGIDLMSVSGHKLHGPKGVGFLYIRNGAKVIPQILGGGQQKGMRSGTDNVPGIAGLGAAAEEIYSRLDANTEHLLKLRRRMTDGLLAMPDVTINGMPQGEGAPHIISVTFQGIRSEVLLHALEEKEIYISAGSACSSHKRKKSAVLTAMGLSAADIESTVRISFSEENTEEEVDFCLQTLGTLVPVLRRYSRR
ncbi:MAG: cysteine desulfurase [Blautia sp.]|nr:cysteine desulfurase [Blautia sp.]